MGVLDLFFGRGNAFESLDGLVRHPTRSKTPQGDPISYSVQMKDTRIRTWQDGDYSNFILKPTITFAPDDPSADTLELKCFRHVGFLELESFRDMFLPAKLRISYEFRELIQAHRNLLFAEILKQRVYLNNALTARNDAPEGSLDVDINQALSVINKHNGLITPVYNVDYALRGNSKPANRRAGRQAYAVGNLGTPKDLAPYTEIIVGNGEQMLKFDAVREFFRYLHQNLNLPRGATANLKAGISESTLIDAEEGDKYYFGVEFSFNIALEGKPPMQLKKREAIGFFEIQEPYDSRLSDTVLRARYEELAHQYAKLMGYDFVIQVGNMLQFNPNIDTTFMLPNIPPLNDRSNPILQSLQRNLALYTPVIGFSNLSIPGHAKVQPSRN